MKLNSVRPENDQAVAVAESRNAGAVAGESGCYLGSAAIPASVSTTRNIFSNLAGNIICAAVGFVLAPILIHGLGDFQYGLWALALALLSSYGLIDTGMRITMQRFVARFKGMNEREALNEVLAAVMLLMVAASALLCALSSVFVFFLPNFFHVNGWSQTLFRGVIGLLAVSIAFTFPARALTTYLCGLQRFDLLNFGTCAATIARAALIVAVLRLGFGLLGVASATLIVEILSLSLYWHLVRRADPGASFHWRNVRKQRVRELASFSFYTYLGNAGDYLRFFTDSAVISRVLGVTLVTPFSVAGRLVDNFRALICTLNSPLTPRMSEFDGQAKMAELKELFFRSTKMTALVSFFIASLVLLDGKSLLRLWLGERFVSSYALLLVLTTGYTLAMAQLPSASLMYARGRHRLLGWWTLGEGAANLLLSVHWARKYGLVGVALGTMVPMLVTSLLIQPLYVVRLLRIPILRYIQEAFAGPILACCLFFAISSIAFSGQAQTKTLFFGLIVVCQCVLFAVLAYVAALSKEERRIALARCRHFAVSLGVSEMAKEF
jgi:O-antigen/teichoic acid export membrane protein